jgi:uncharacterized protein (DUF1330 family)
MKKLFYLLLIIPFSISAQFAVADYIVLNEGMDSQYNDLEKVWKAYHQQSINAGEKMGWAVWKTTPNNSTNENAAHYVVINQFSSKEQMEKWTKNFDYNKAVLIMKSELKGKMSSRTINRILSKGPSIKKEVRVYSMKLMDATPLTGGDLKIGDKMTYAPMIQKSDDYEKVESFIAKPYFLKQVMNGKHRWWGFTKIIDRNENAYENITHIAWNIGIPNAVHDDYMVENEFIQQVLTDKMNSSREMLNAQELTLVHKSD